MNKLKDLRQHRAATLLFITLWVTVWVVTVVTWARDAAGFSIGMAPSLSRCTLRCLSCLASASIVSLTAPGVHS